MSQIDRSKPGHGRILPGWFKAWFVLIVLVVASGLAACGGGNSSQPPSNSTQTYTVTTTVVGSGTVSRSPNLSSYASGSVVALTATPAAGYAFSGWSGDLSGATNPTTIVVNSPKTVTATFAPGYSVTVNVVGSGTVTKSPSADAYASGSSVTLTASPASGYVFSGWSGDLTGSTNPATVTINANKTVTATFDVATSYSFPPYTNVPEGFSHQTYLDNPTLTIRQDWDGVARSITGGYIAFREGPSHPASLTDDQIKGSLARVNSDLKYLVEQLGIRHHPTTQSPTNNYMNWYLLGSGLPGDNTPTTNTPETGYQGWRWWAPASAWMPVVEMTYQDFTVTPDDYHRWAITHEFGHVLQHGYGVLTHDYAGWFHEAHNDYMMAHLRKGLTGVQTVGWITPYALMASYLPIESWGPNSDGEASGPGGRVPNGSMMDGSYSGGYASYRYSILFPLFLSQRTKRFFTNALWEQATPTETVIQTIARLLGPEQAKRLLTEYGARNAILDYDGFAADLKSTLNSAWGREAHNWMYTATQESNGWLVPSDPVRLPRYTGRNNIPITVSSGATQVSVEFVPDTTGSRGTTATMTAQLVYRDTAGNPVFSEPVTNGTTTLTLAGVPSNGTVILVITNVTLSGFTNPDPKFGWDVSERFGYKFRILSGGTTAPVSGKYF
ncbi:MAG TPA: DUF6055 domain-containing protein [Terriglobales bacterium]|nr:DUF6055 domain-containing protein [Terriglobales bacterium]